MEPASTTHGWRCGGRTADVELDGLTGCQIILLAVTAVAVLRSDDDFGGEIFGPTYGAQVGPHRQRARHFLVAGSIS